MSDSDPGYRRLLALARIAIPEPGGEATDAQVRQRLVEAHVVEAWDHAACDAHISTLAAAHLIAARPDGRWCRVQDPPPPPDPRALPGRWAEHQRRTEKDMMRAELRARQQAAEALAQPVRDARRAEVLSLLVEDGRLVEPFAAAVRRLVTDTLAAERAGDTATTLEVSHA
jgi:hypothetical protein